jgi:hypothetical protein
MTGSRRHTVSPEGWFRRYFKLHGAVLDASALWDLQLRRDLAGQ